MLFGNFRIFLVTSNLKVMKWMELLNFLFPPTLSTQTFWAIDQSFGKSIKQKKGRRGGGRGAIIIYLSCSLANSHNP